MKTTAPSDARETPTGGSIVTLPGGDDASVTFFPPTGFPFPSARRTTTWAAVVPSAGTAVATPSSAGSNAFPGPTARTTDTEALTAPGVWDVSRWWSRARFGEPSPTCAKSVPMDAAS